MLLFCTLRQMEDKHSMIQFIGRGVFRQECNYVLIACHSLRPLMFNFYYLGLIKSLSSYHSNMRVREELNATFVVNLKLNVSANKRRNLHY